MFRKSLLRDFELLVFLAFSIVLTVAVFFVTNTLLGIGIYSIVPSIGTLLVCIRFGRKKLK